MAAAATMKAVVNPEYGPPDALRLRDVDRPTIGEDQVLIRVHAASVNPYDWHLVRGKPYFARLIVGIRRPKSGGIPGVDAAGVVEAVGTGVTELRPGDEVFGSCSGTFAEYTVGRERNLAPRPENLALEQAAAIPGAGATALQGVRDHGGVQPGQRVLVNGAAGGVGTFAVQIARALGAHVTGVCSTRNVELVRSLGAEQVVDYSAEDFTRSGPYDVIVDNVGNRSLRELRRALGPTGTYVAVGGGMRRKLGARLVNRFVAQRLESFIARVRTEDLVALKELIEAGEVDPVVGRIYPLSEAPDAIRYVETGHASGKVVVTVRCSASASNCR